VKEKRFMEECVESLGFLPEFSCILTISRLIYGLMHIMVVLAHPIPGSFNGAVCDALCEGLRETGHTIDRADLNAEGFDPVLRGPELDLLGVAPPDQDVAAYQQRVLRADALAFIFPVWWFGLPSILKGFIDRVFQEGFAFRFTSGGRVRGLLAHKRALVICTAGASSSLYRRFGFSGPLEKTFVEWTLQTCGVRMVRQVVFHNMKKASATTRARYLKQARQLGREFFGE
jgi:NAD(P)H dehydrogenase (quinone)